MREEEGGSCLQPVHSSAEGHGRSFNGLVEIYEIEGNLDSGFMHLQWEALETGGWKVKGPEMRRPVG